MTWFSIKRSEIKCTVLFIKLLLMKDINWKNIVPWGERSWSILWTSFSEYAGVPPAGPWYDPARTSMYPPFESFFSVYQNHPCICRFWSEDNSVCVGDWRFCFGVRRQAQRRAHTAPLKPNIFPKSQNIWCFKTGNLYFSYKPMLPV